MAAEGPDRVPPAPRAPLEEPANPLPGYHFRGTELVYDLVYSPALTPLLARAQAAGCYTIGGLAMLQAQGRAQFSLFTGRDYPEVAAG